MTGGDETEETNPDPAGEAIPPQLSDLLAQAQHQLEGAAGEAAEAVIIGRAGGGAVEIRLNGNLEALAVHVDPDLMQPGEASMLEDLVLAALRHALSQASEVRERLAASMLPPGLDLDSMIGTLFGAGGEGPAAGGLGELPDLSQLMGNIFGGGLAAGGEDDEPFPGEDSEQA